MSPYIKYVCKEGFFLWSWATGEEVDQVGRIKSQGKGVEAGLLDHFITGNKNHVCFFPFSFNSAVSSNSLQKKNTIIY